MRSGLRRLALRAGRGLVKLGAPGRQLALFHYPVELGERPDNESLAAVYREREPAFAATLARLVSAGRDHVRELPEPNPWFSPLDSFTLYAFIADRQPATYLEIGSGISTTVAAAARRSSPATHIVSIDPKPRVEIDQLCDTVVRARLEDVGTAPFASLRSGDVVLFDGSHLALPGGDVAVFMLEVLPALPPGVLVGIHDVYLPGDYPDWMRAAYASEQYVVAAWLLGGSADKVVLPNAWVKRSAHLRALVEPVLADDHGVLLWLET